MQEPSFGGCCRCSLSAQLAGETTIPGPFFPVSLWAAIEAGKERSRSITSRYDHTPARPLTEPFAARPLSWSRVGAHWGTSSQRSGCPLLASTCRRRTHCLGGQAGTMSTGVTRTGIYTTAFHHHDLRGVARPLSPLGRCDSGAQIRPRLARQSPWLLSGPAPYLRRRPKLPVRPDAQRLRSFLH